MMFLDSFLSIVHELHWNFVLAPSLGPHFPPEKSFSKVYSCNTGTLDSWLSLLRLEISDSPDVGLNELLVVFTADTSVGLGGDLEPLSSLGWFKSLGFLTRKTHKPRRAKHVSFYIFLQWICDYSTPEECECAPGMKLCAIYLYWW